MKNGYIRLYRKIVENDIWDKPPIYLKVWIWLLNQAQYKEYKSLRRGQLITTLDEIRKNVSYCVGYRKIMPSRDVIYDVLSYLRDPKQDKCELISGGNTEGNDEGNDEGNGNNSMIATMKATRGLLITICNYDKYQLIENHEGNDEGNGKQEHEGNDESDTATHTAPQHDKGRRIITKEKRFTEKDKELSLLLENLISKNSPAHKKATDATINSWADTIRLMRERDNRTYEDIQTVIEWCQNDSFWLKNILSAGKLRDKYEQLVIQMPKNLISEPEPDFHYST